MNSSDLFPESLWIGHRFDKFLIEFGINPARRNGVAANALRARVDRHGPRQGMQPSLGGAVGGVLGVRPESLDRADVNDSALVSKVGQGVLDQEKRCREVDIECSVPVRQGHGFDRVFQHDTGIVDERVEATMAIDDLLDNAFRCIGV